MRIIPSNNGVIVEHHFRNADGLPTGSPDRYTHNTMGDVHDHLDEHLAPHMPEDGARAEAGMTAATGTSPRGRRA
jgi:hypothetical protein